MARPNARGTTVQCDGGKHRPARTREVENGQAAFQRITSPSTRHGWPGEGIYRPSRRHIGHRLGLMQGAFPTAAPPAYLSRLVGPRDRSRRSLILPALHKQEQLWEQRLVVEEARRDGRIAAWGEKIITALTENRPS